MKWSPKYKKWKIKAMVCHVAKCASNFTRVRLNEVGESAWKGLIKCNS